MHTNYILSGYYALISVMLLVASNIHLLISNELSACLFMVTAS